MRCVWFRSWLLALLVLSDVVELALSLALAAVRPAAPVRQRLPYPTFDVPYTPTSVTTVVAVLGVVLGVWIGVSLIAEIVVLFRRAQIKRYRYGARATVSHAPPARS